MEYFKVSRIKKVKKNILERQSSTLLKQVLLGTKSPSRQIISSKIELQVSKLFNVADAATTFRCTLMSSKSILE
jgi:hypothetical protein